MCPGTARAHASQQSFVLLLPTDVYTGAGIAVVVLTVLALFLVPGAALRALFHPVPVTVLTLARLRPLTSTLSCLMLLGLIWVGFTGPRDPLGNPLPLAVWTVFWIGCVTVQGLVGDIWSYVNPWSGPLRLVRGLVAPKGFARLPRGIGHWVALASFLCFAFVLLADPAPGDPARLAQMTAAYWAFHMAFALVFGPRWLRRAEGLTLMLGLYSRLAIFGRFRGRLCLGLPGWQIAHKGIFAPGPSLLIVILLGTGSFDGLNETFWWLGLLGLNPLEFPGRSAVVAQNTVGLLAANGLLIMVFATALWLGLRLAGPGMSPGLAIRRFAPSLLPIALGYHVAHYLPSFLVDAQYALVALSDPFMTGADPLGLGEFYVSTGFFNSRASVRLIFLAQAGAVVAGHVLALLVAHAIALRAFALSRAAALSQLPLSAFMIAYTFFGLWLLASPRF